MNNGPIILSETGSKIFWAHDAWHEHCEEEGIADPWQLMRECSDKVNKHWVETDKKGRTTWYAETKSKDEWPKEILEEYKKLEAYRDEYMCDREIWEGQYILKEYGYETLLAFARNHGHNQEYDLAFWDWFITVLPCEGYTGQCSFDCPVIGNCNGDLHEFF